MQSVFVYSDLSHDLLSSGQHRNIVEGELMNREQESEEDSKQFLMAQLILSGLIFAQVCALK